jgi:hypothetical protein
MASNFGISALFFVNIHPEFDLTQQFIGPKVERGGFDTYYTLIKSNALLKCASGANSAANRFAYVTFPLPNGYTHFPAQLPTSARNGTVFAVLLSLPICN